MGSKKHRLRQIPEFIPGVSGLFEWMPLALAVGRTSTSRRKLAVFRRKRIVCVKEIAMRENLCKTYLHCGDICGTLFLGL